MDRATRILQLRVEAFGACTGPAGLELRASVWRCWWRDLIMKLRVQGFRVEGFEGFEGSRVWGLRG